MTAIICFSALLGVSFCGVVGSELYTGLKNETK